MHAYTVFERLVRLNMHSARIAIALDRLQLYHSDHDNTITKSEVYTGCLTVGGHTVSRRHH